MFSSSVAGTGSLCLGCQLRAVTRRTPVVVAATSSAAAAAHNRIRSQQRRYAAGQSEAGSSNANDYAVARALNEQRYNDPYDHPDDDEDKTKKKKKKPLIHLTRHPADEPFVRTFVDTSLREGTYSQPEVSFEDVWQQDTDVEGANDALERAMRQNTGGATREPVDNPDEIDYGSVTYDTEPPAVGQFSWNMESPSDLRYEFSRRNQQLNGQQRKRHEAAEEDWSVLDHNSSAEAKNFSWAETKDFSWAETKDFSLDEEKDFNSTSKRDEKFLFSRGRGFEKPRQAPDESRLLSSGGGFEKSPRAGRPMLSTRPIDELFGWNQEIGEERIPGHRSIWRGKVDEQQQQSPLPADSASSEAPPATDEAAKIRIPGHRSIWHGKGDEQQQQSPLPADSASSEAPPATDEAAKNYVRKGRLRLLTDTAEMSIATLGEDSSVIVLKEDGEWPFEREKKDHRPKDPIPDVTKSTDQEEGLSLDAIMENIDELRPVDRILPAREFKVVFDTLRDGFTAYHLESYVEQDQKRRDEGDERPYLGVQPEHVKERPWIVAQGHWVPEVEGAVEDMDYRLKGYILKSMPPKQRLVMQLMRECWDMSVQELLYGLGVLDVKVRALEFKLLTLGSQRFLQTFSRVHLSAGADRSIKVIKSRNALQITAPKSVAEAILQAMDDLFQKTVTKVVTLTNATTARFTATILERVGELTNSVLELDETKTKLSVTWLDVKKRQDSNLEDVRDIVLRLIRHARPPLREDTALAVYPDPSQAGKLVADMSDRSKLSWSDRRLAWARLCLPVTAKAQAAPLHKTWPLGEAMLKYKVEPVTDDFIVRKSVLKKKIQAYSVMRTASVGGVPLSFPRPRRYTEQELIDEVTPPTSATPSGWLPFRVRSDAVFGHVLHLNHPDAAASLAQGTDALAASRRTLDPLIPPITEMHLPGWVPYPEPSNMTNFIVMRFLPTNPEAPSAAATTPEPTLELRLKASDEAVICIDSLRAIAHTHVADICLPAGPVDVRATQRLVAELPGAALDSTPGMEPLAEFLRQSVLEPTKATLITPPALENLGLPAWLRYAPETDLDSQFLRSTSKKAKMTSRSGPPQHNPYHLPANAITPTSYLFAGLEIHSVVETAYDGWKLTYTSIEAGAGGGRRAELALTAAPAFDKEMRRNQNDVSARNWLRSVYALATSRVAAKVTGEGDEDSPLGARASTVVSWLGLKH